MGFKIFGVNEYLTSGDTNAFFAQQQIAIKSADESVTSSTTVQDDNHLFMTLNANRNYWVDGNFITDGAVGGDFRMQFVVRSEEHRVGKESRSRGVVVRCSLFRSDMPLSKTQNANTNYWVDGNFITDGAVGGDFRMQFVVPSGTIRWLPDRPLSRCAAHGTEGEPKT